MTATREEVFPHSFNWWQEQEMRRALNTGERIFRISEKGQRVRFVIVGRDGERPFAFTPTCEPGCPCPHGN